MIVTSSGIIRNEDKPRVGVVNAHSLASWIFDEVSDGVDLTYESYMLDLKGEHDQAHLDHVEECEAAHSVGRHSDATSDHEEEDFDDCRACQRLCEQYESNDSTILIGSWKKNDETGLYEIETDRGGDYAATYNSGSGLISVEWSRRTRRVGHTSPCFVMANGDGPCGDLDSEGDTVLAYDLPETFYEKDGDA